MHVVALSWEATEALRSVGASAWLLASHVVVLQSFFAVRRLPMIASASGSPIAAQGTSVAHFNRAKEVSSPRLVLCLLPSTVARLIPRLATLLLVRVRILLRVFAFGHASRITWHFVSSTSALRSTLGKTACDTSFDTRARARPRHSSSCGCWDVRSKQLQNACCRQGRPRSGKSAVCSRRRSSSLQETCWCAPVPRGRGKAAILRARRATCRRRSSSCGRGTCRASDAPCPTKMGWTRAKAKQTDSCS